MRACACRRHVGQIQRAARFTCSLDSTPPFLVLRFKRTSSARTTPEISIPWRKTLRGNQRSLIDVKGLGYSSLRVRPERRCTLGSGCQPLIETRAGGEQEGGAALFRCKCDRGARYKARLLWVHLGSSVLALPPSTFPYHFHPVSGPLTLSTLHLYHTDKC